MDLRKIENLSYQFSSHEELFEVLPYIVKITRLSQSQIKHITSLYGEITPIDYEYDMLKSKLLAVMRSWQQHMIKFGVRPLENWCVSIKVKSEKEIIKQF